MLGPWGTGGGYGLPEAFHEFGGKPNPAEVGFSFGEAMTVRTPGDKQAAFCGNAGEDNDILGRVGRMEHLDPLKSCFNEFGEVRQPVLARMGKDCDARRVADGRDGLIGGETDPLHIGRPPLSQEMGEGVLQSIHDSVREQSPGHVEPSYRALPGDLKDVSQGQRDPQSVQPTEDFFESLVPFGLQRKNRFLKRRVFPVDKVAQDVGLSVGFKHREFNAWDDLDLQLAARLECLGYSGDGVMIGEGNRVHLAGSRLGNDLSRGKAPIRVGGVKVKVRSKRGKRTHLIASAVSESKKRKTDVNTIGKIVCNRQGQGGREISVLAYHLRTPQ